MAAIDNFPTPPNGLRVFSRLSNLRKAMRRWQSRRELRKAVSRMSDWELADLGLVRGNIERIER